MRSLVSIGMQIMGRRHADADVLAASAVFERARPWHDDYRASAAISSDFWRGAIGKNRQQPKE
jgi:hypothetical protein